MQGKISICIYFRNVYEIIQMKIDLLIFWCYPFKKKWYFLIPLFFRTTITRLWKSWVRLAGRNMHMDIPLCVPVGRRRLKLGNRKWLVGLANQAGRSRPTSPVIVGSGVLLCWPCSGASYWQLFGAIVWPSDVAKFRNLMYNFVAF